MSKLTFRLTNPVVGNLASPYIDDLHEQNIYIRQTKTLGLKLQKMYWLIGMNSKLSLDIKIKFTNQFRYN